MKHWKETAEILRRALALHDAGRRAALATVVRIEGSAYRRPGAKFLVEEDGRTRGSISGGCLEGDVREVALEIVRGGAPRLLRYETGGDDGSPFSLGLGCAGTIEVFVQPATTGPALEAAREILERLGGDAPFAIETVLGGEEAGRIRVRDAAGADRGAPADPAVFVEVLEPPSPLLVFGAGDDAIPLCAYAADAGFRVTVVDHRPAILTPERFPGAFRLVGRRSEEGTAGLPVGPRAFAVVKTHSFAHDRRWTGALLEAGVPYIGLLGPRQRGAQILSQIGAGDADRVFSPVGLDLGAEGPEQVALAIVAELLAVRSSRAPWSLREKEGAIHAG